MHQSGTFGISSGCRSTIVLLFLLLRTVVDLQMLQMSPRVVFARQTVFQGFLGPGNVPPRPGNNNNRDGYAQGHPVVEVSAKSVYGSLIK